MNIKKTKASVRYFIYLVRGVHFQM